MYKIIGADGREYGPVSAEHLRQWLSEGRVNARTRVWVEGAAVWRPLTEFAEFAQLLAGGPVAVPRFAPSPRTNPLATTGMILGIFSLTLGCCCYGVPFNILGLVFSLVALSQIQRDPLRQQGRGQAIAGLVLSLLSLAFGLFAIIFGIAVNSSDVLRRIQHL